MRCIARSLALACTTTLALSFGSLTPATAQDQPADPPRAQRPAMKGLELYSWVDPQTGAWRYRLMMGTNRNKTISEITGPGTEMLDFDGLKAAIAKLAIGEHIGWSSETGTGNDGCLALPDAKTRDEITQLCSKLQIELYIATGDPVPAVKDRAALIRGLQGRWRLRITADSDAGTKMLASYHRMVITPTRIIWTFGNMDSPRECTWSLTRIEGKSCVLVARPVRGAGGSPEQIPLTLVDGVVKTEAGTYERDPGAKPVQKEPREAVQGMWRVKLDANASDEEKMFADVMRLTIGSDSCMRTLSGSMSQWSYAVTGDEFGVLTVRCEMPGQEAWTEKWVASGNELAITRGEKTTTWVSVEVATDPREQLLGVWDFSIKETLESMPGWAGMGEEQRERRRERYRDEITLEITLGTYTCHACYDYVVHSYRLEQTDKGLVIVLDDGKTPADRIAVTVSADGTKLNAEVRGLPRVFVRR
ncbi:MAG: hypothetical protein AB7S36_00120 [Planctomycetota bacterium]